MKRIFQLLKIFILSEKCLSVAWMHFSKVKMLKIWNFFQGENSVSKKILKLLNFHFQYRKGDENGSKSFGNEIFSYSWKQEATKHVVSKKILNFWKFSFWAKSAYQSLECIFPRWKCSKFETSEFVLDMVLKVSQTKFYQIPAEKKRQTFSFKKNY